LSLVRRPRHLNLDPAVIVQDTSDQAVGFEIAKEAENLLDAQAGHLGQFLVAREASPPRAFGKREDDAENQLRTGR
jgi:hypothetical protein